MKRRLPCFTWLLYASLPCLLVVLAYFPIAKILAASTVPVVNLSGSAKPFVNAQSVRPLKLSYTGKADAVAALQAGAKPVSLTSADFDDDGAPDLVAGYSTAKGGVITLTRGNPDAFAPKDTSWYAKAAQGNVPPTFLTTSTAFSLAGSPDFLAAADFDGDGNKDLLVGTRGGGLYFLAGDGHGNLAAPSQIALPGTLSALAVNSAGHVATGVENRGIAQLLIFAPQSTGGFSQPVATRSLSAPATSMEWGQLAINTSDLAVAAGNSVVVFYSAINSGAQSETIDLPFHVQALTIGDFIWNRDGRMQIAALGDDGAVHILQHGTLDTRPLTNADIPGRRARMAAKASSQPAQDPTSLGAWSDVKQLAGATTSTAGVASQAMLQVSHMVPAATSGLMVLDGAQRQVSILNTSVDTLAGTSASTSAAAAGAQSMAISAAPVAAHALPPMLNGRRTLVVLTSSSLAPIAMDSPPDPTFDVTWQNDEDDVSACLPAANGGSGATTGAGADNHLSLREAICEANNSGGGAAYTINVPAGTYNLNLSTGGLQTPLPCVCPNDYWTGETGEIYVGTTAGETFTIMGMGTTPADTVINQEDGIDRIFEEDVNVKGNVPLTIENMTLSGGNCVHYFAFPPGDCSEGGGAVFAGGLAGDDLTIKSVVMENNTAGGQCVGGCGTGPYILTGYGGAVAYDGGTFMISGSTFSTNNAVASGVGGVGSGGAVYLEEADFGSGNLTVTSSTFTGNTSGVGGGLELQVAQGALAMISGSTFTGNKAQESGGAGGAIHADNPNPNTTYTLTVSGSRIVGNTATNGSGFAAESGAAGTVTDNWWGCNLGPGNPNCDKVYAGTASTATFNPWLVLSIGASPTAVNTNGTSTLTADLAHNSNGGTGSNVPDGTDVTFAPGTLGSVNPTSTTFTSGTATSTFTAGATSGMTSSTATVDSQTVSLPVPITISSASATHFSVTASSPQAAGSAFNFTVTALGADNTTATGYTGTVQFSSTDHGPGTTLPPNYIFTSGAGLDNGVHTFSATLKTPGNQTITATDTVTSSITGTSGTIAVLSPPTISKAFGASQIAVGGTTTLTFTLTNPSANTVTLTGVAFSDTLSSGLQVATSPGVVNNCSGTFAISTTASTTTLYLNGGSIPASGSCTISINVTGTASGVVTNTTSVISSTNGGAGTTSNTATLLVVSPPAIGKSFSPTTIPLNGVSTLSLTLTNPNASVTLTGVNFSDNFTPGSGLQVANPAGIGSTCSGTWNATPGDTTLNFGGGTLPGGSSCTLTVNVTATSAGMINNYANPPQSNEGGTGVASNTATLTVIAPPSISKAFELMSQIAASPSGATESGSTVTITTVSAHGFLTGQSVTIAGVGVAGYNGPFTIASVPTPTTFTYTDTNTGLAASGGGTAAVPITTMPLNGTATLAFTLTNSNSGTALTGIGFTDALPAGLQVATPPNASAPCGTFAPNAGDTTLTFSGGTVAASGTCIVSVNITATTAGVKNNTTGNVTSNEGGTGSTASASVTVLSPPSISKAFGAANISPGGTTTLTFTITNPNAANQLTGVSFTDSLPSGLAVASTPGASTSCGGTFAPNSGDTTLTFSGGTIADAGTCTVSVNVTATSPGVKNNTTGNVTSTNGGAGNTGSASVTVAMPPSISKAFGASSIPLNGSTSLSFTITNPNSSIAFTGVAFTDTLPPGLVVATPNSLSNTCGGTPTAVAGSASVSLSAGTLADSASCTVSVNVTGTNAGVENNSVTVTSTTAGTGNTATASITVVAPPAIGKAFGAASIALGGSTSLSFTITNSNTTTTLTGIGFSDTLPAGLVVSTPNGETGVCGSGTITATAGTGTISLSGATLASSGSCTFSVNVTGIVAGTQNNTTGNVTSTEGGTGTTGTASITVVAPPSIAKAFGAASVALNGTTSLTFTITNPTANTVTESGVAFTDTLPSGLVVATPNGLTGSCGGGSITATAGTGVISLSGATLAASGSCTFSVNVTGTTAGTKNNSVTVSSTNGGTGNTAMASIAVAMPPSIGKAFGVAGIPLNGSTSLTFTITNPNSNVALAGVAFTDSLPAGLAVATPNGLSSTCGGTATAVAGSGSVSLSAGALADSASCTVSVNVTGTSAGVENNSVTVTSTTAGTGNTATASITVVAPPAIGKVFGAASIALGGSTSLSFTITNTNTTTTLSGIGFSDTLPAGLVISTPNGETGVCGSGTITATAGTGTISLSGATLASSGSCTFSVNVTGTTAGAKTNTTGNVTSVQGGTGGTAMASIAVVAPPTISKAFSPSTILPGGSTTLTFTLTNPSANTVAEAGVAFTDTLPAGLVVASPNGLTNTCGGVVTATAGTTSISLAGGSISTNTNCTIAVNITATTNGVKTNITGPVSSTTGGTGTTSNTATLTVDQPPHVTSLNFATFTKGVQGTFTVTTTGYPVPSLSFSPAGSLPAGVTFVDNHNGTATISGKPTVSGTFSFWITASNGVSPEALQSFTLTVEAH
jgi:uncharacterized repeat protein (TIGR01451 family)